MPTINLGFNDGINVPDWLLLAICSVGILKAISFCFQTCLVLLQTFFMRGTSLSRYRSKSELGSWVVVTGATDGIGKEFAVQLAAAKFNVVLISRNMERLKNVAEQIEKQYGCSTRTIAIDFASAKEIEYSMIAKAVHTLDIAVLVNNVGRSHEMPVAFADTDVEEQDAILSININGTLRVTNIILKNMLKQRRGLILTMSSFAGAIPSPLLATYSGSKAFLQTWSDALQAELADKGVDVECVNTYFVVSSMSRIRRASALIPIPKHFVSSVLKKIGLQCGALWTGRPSVSTPYWSHALLDFGIHLIGWKWLFIRYSLALHKDIRIRALRKKERETKSI